MSVVIVSGDFCSGSTLVFTLFRQTQQYSCLYEPLHEDLHEFLIYGLRPDEASHHAFVDQYHTEFQALPLAGDLSRRRWGLEGFHLASTDEDPELKAFLRYLIHGSLATSPRVMLKDNRLTFRLGWLRANFPDVKLVHIHRGVEAQWRSVVRRTQADRGRSDVGQDRTDFDGFGIARWCDDLQQTYPELEASRSNSGFERFSRLWALSLAENRKYADVSIAYEDLLGDFHATARRMFDAADGRDVDVDRLSSFVVTPTTPAPVHWPGWAAGTGLRVADRVLRRFAHHYASWRWAEHR